MPGSLTTDPKGGISSQASDVEKQLAHEVPVVQVVAPKTLGAGVRTIPQKIHEFANLRRQRFLLEFLQRL